MGVLLIRTVIVYIIVVFSLRIMGKRQLGELQPSELVVTILVSNLATLSIEDTNVPLLGSVLPIFMLVICEVTVSILILKSNGARKLISGNPRIVIRDGQIDQKEMRNLRWTIDDLMEQLRGIGIFDVNEVSFAIVETSGNLSAYQKYKDRPVTAEMLELASPGGGDDPAQTIISDGVIVPDALRFCNLRQEWLDKVLAEQKLRACDVFLMTCNRNAAYHIVQKERKR
jgi:uncharacterized membrane protein YcaP (DUF421 family)